MLRHLGRLFVVASSLISVQSADAIIIRHDRADDAYVQLASSYPAATPIKPDGAGVLVAPRFILTAAHVARGIAEHDQGVLIAGRAIPVERIFSYPGWDGPGPHDIALLRLASRVDDVPPVKLYRGSDEEGRVVILVGSGDTGTGETGPQKLDHKKRAATNRIEGVDDDWIYFTFDRGEVATDLEGVSGPGDSGGPALIEDHGSLYVVGVSVFALEGEPGRYGTREAYARVSTHLEWIDSILDGSSTEAGFAPGQGPSRHEVETSMARGDETLDDVPGGEIVKGYLDAYNVDAQTLFQFLELNVTDGYIRKKTPEEQIAFHGRLVEIFGNLTLRGIVESSSERLVIRVAGSSGVDGDLFFHFKNGKIEDFATAVIEVDSE
ncbi:MAG: trypsin-like serine protease [Candidatus Krumholzibacteria bacterium]|nr:trypsin-like serine protease [Candidatus Krumholzibacteria bacterium]